MANPFISLEDEIMLRRSVKVALKHEGLTGGIQILGEIAASMQVVIEVMQEIVEEEKKNND